MATGSKPSLLNTLPNNLPFEFLKDITEGFSDARKLGAGVSKTVYKGILQDGQTIAVKKFADNWEVPPEKMFKMRIVNLLAIQHTNIVRLLGYCREPQKKAIEHNGRFIVVDVVETLLYYEYIPNGDLAEYIFDKSSRPDWKTCFEIIKGICKGLRFLHMEMGTPMVHLDLQPSNILLDNNMVPKISDFDHARLFPEEEDRMYTLNVVGKTGYMAPEYLYRGEISLGSDIYSLGIVIMEITTGEMNSSSNKDKSARDFIDKVRTTWTDDYIASMYSNLDAVSLQEVRTCIEIGLKCVAMDQYKRPSIGEIVDELHGMKVQ